MEQAIAAIEICAKRQVPFAAWRMPGDERVSFCAAPSLMADPSSQFAEGAPRSGFFISEFAKPFAQASWIPFEVGAEDVLAMEMPDRELPALRSESTDKDTYITRLYALVAQLKARGNAKTVISIVKTVDATRLDVAEMAKQLFANGKGMFCSCWLHPRFGLWIGATPELLLSMRGGRLRSVALAGTAHADEPWDDKNKAEHKFVIDYIANALANNHASPTISETYTVGFGHLKHLRTDFDASVAPDAEIAAFVDALNPTPALCGYPKAQALSDISAIESHTRGCYGGLVGVASGDSIDAYVNIRCAQVGDAQLKFYTGGGITADSEPEAEWTEAQDKRKQLMHLLNIDHYEI